MPREDLPICFDIEGNPSPTIFVATTVIVILVEGGQVDKDVKKVSVHIVELQEAFTTLQLVFDNVKHQNNSMCKKLLHH